MKRISEKIISTVISICLTVTGLPLMVYAKSITPEISLEEFSHQLRQLKLEQNKNFVSEITFENGEEFYHLNGEEYFIESDCESAVTVNENDFEIPLSVIEPYCELPEISAYSFADENDGAVSIDKETAEALGFNVEIEEDKAVLTQPYQTCRLIVKSQFDINPLDSVAIVEGYNDLHIVQFDSQESTRRAEEYYNSQLLIEFAEPDLVVSTLEYEDSGTESVVSYGINDYGQHLSWGSESIGVDDYIDYLGDRSNLPEIVVGIIDTGIDVDHDFLKDRVIRTNYNISTSGAENDENDDKGHGTHVAGIIVDNTLDNVKIKGYKVLSSSGTGTMSDVISGFEQAVADGTKIINLSLGVKGESKLLEKAVNSATEAGITVCAAAGNHGSDSVKYCPANIENCITVAAIASNDELPYWSNWGSLVDIVAPGVSIYSTYLDNGYETLSGTSMACPFAVAASALLLSKNINLNADGICTLLEENGRVWTNKIYIDSLWDKMALYLATITEYNQYRTEKPVFSMESGRYSDSVTVELSCPEENAEIYYTLDGSRASKANGILYTGPIVIDKVTKVHAAAYAGDKLKSLQAIADYYITVTDSDDTFEIDTDGLIVKYNGNNLYLTIPDTVNGITVTGIGQAAFREQGIVMIKFPDTLTYVAKRGFAGKTSLKSVYCKNLKVVGERAFYGCSNLDTIDLTQLEKAGAYSFRSCSSIPEVKSDKLTRLEKGTFASLRNAVGVDLPNVTYIGGMALASLNNAEYINIPKVEVLGSAALVSAFLVDTLDLPNLTTLEGSGHFHATGKLKTFNAPNLTGNIPQGTFSGSGIEYIDLPNVTSLDKSAIDCSRTKAIRLPKITTIGAEAFTGCSVLENVYIPSATEIDASAFKGCSNLKRIFAPKAASLQVMESTDTVIYLSDACKELNIAADGNFTFIAPSGSYAETFAKENGYAFIPSDSRNADIENPSNIADLGRSICVSAAGLRFGFNWGNIKEIEQYADNIDYGFIYSTNGIEDLSIDTVDNENVRKTQAVNRVENDTDTSFNLVFANIPKEYLETKMSARAYVCIDGMYFYSNVSTGSFVEVAQLVLADASIDEATKEAVRGLLVTNG